MATNLDDQLLNRNDKDDAAAARAGDLSATKESITAPPTLREAVLAEKRRRAAQAKQEGKSATTPQAGVAGALVSPVRLATGNLLKQCWLHLIDSFGLTLIWINVHVFLHMVVGEKFFCKLGEEWTMSNPVAGSVGGAGAAGVASAAGAPKMSGTVEAMALGALDLIFLFLIIAIVSVVAMIVGPVSNPLETIKTILGTLWRALAGSQ
jgi:hypothetical protein